MSAATSPAAGARMIVEMPWVAKIMFCAEFDRASQRLYFFEMD
jgi:hypothetical protein